MDFDNFSVKNILLYSPFYLSLTFIMEIKARFLSWSSDSIVLPKATQPESGDKSRTYISLTKGAFPKPYES